MKDIITKLLSDLKARLRGKKRLRPSRKEIDRWGASKIPAFVPLALYGAYLAFATLGVPEIALSLPEWLIYLLFAWPGWIMFFVGFQELHKSLNHYLIVNAYHGLLKKNERFTLVEYCKYLERQIERATEDQSMGGAE